MSDWEQDDEADVMDGFAPSDVIDAEGVSSGSTPVETHPSRSGPRFVRSGSVRLVVRPLTPSMEQRYPDVVSILVTHKSGGQVLYHRGAR